MLVPVFHHFIRGQLTSLNPGELCIGLDDVSSLFLHDGAGSIVIPVAHITNLSFSKKGRISIR